MLTLLKIYNRQFSNYWNTKICKICKVHQRNATLYFKFEFLQSYTEFYKFTNFTSFVHINLYYFSVLMDVHNYIYRVFLVCHNLQHTYVLCNANIRHWPGVVLVSMRLNKKNIYITQINVSHISVNTHWWYDFLFIVKIIITLRSFYMFFNFLQNYLFYKIYSLQVNLIICKNEIRWKAVI